MISSFTAIIGNDTPEKVNALNALKNSLGRLDEKSAQRAEDRIMEIAQREQQAEAEATDELETALEGIEENFDVDFSNQKLRSEFVTFVEKIAPKDRNGDVIDYPDMQSAWETFSTIQKSSQQPNRAKGLASRSMSRGSESQPAQAKKVGWDSIDEYIDGL